MLSSKKKNAKFVLKMNFVDVAKKRRVSELAKISAARTGSAKLRAVRRKNKLVVRRRTAELLLPKKRCVSLQKQNGRRSPKKTLVVVRKKSASVRCVLMKNLRGRLSLLVVKPSSLSLRRNKELKTTYALKKSDDVLSTRPKLTVNGKKSMISSENWNAVDVKPTLLPRLNSKLKLNVCETSERSAMPQLLKMNDFALKMRRCA